MSDPTVRETQQELRRVVLALVVLGLGITAVCTCRPSRVTRIRNPNQAAPVNANGRSLSVQGPEKPAGWLPDGAAVAPHPGRARGACYSPAGEPNSERGESRFLRFRRASWDRRCVLSG